MDKKIIKVEDIKNKIYTVRGMQVMIDAEVAELFQVETKVLNQAVRRNMERFPERFCFQLSEYEKRELVTNCDRLSRLKHSSVCPFAFSESGIAMLSSILHSDVAIKMSIQIMDAFIEIRHFISENALTLQHLRDIDFKLLEYDKNFQEIFKRLENPKEAKAVLFFKGQLWDATSLIEDLIAKACKSITLIDNYVDKKTLDLFSNRNSGVRISIFTSSRGNGLTKKEISDFNSQYGFLEVHTTEEFHDRFMILDEKVLYHIGASIKDAGKKAFEISLIEDEEQTKMILKRICWNAEKNKLCNLR